MKAGALQPDDAVSHSDLGSALAGRGSRRRRSPNSARQPGSDPMPPRPTTASASPCTTRGSWRKRSPIPHGDPARARLRRGPQRPRKRPESPGEARGGDRRIPHGDPDHTRASPRPTTTSASRWKPRGTWRRRSPKVARQSGSNPTTPRPTTVSAAPWTARGSTRRQSPKADRLSRSNPATLPQQPGPGTGVFPRSTSARL